MALTGTDRGSGNHNTSALSFTLSPASNFTAGALAVLCLSVDNADSSGAGHSTFTVTDSLGNTWTRRTSPLYDPGAASAGVEGAIFTSPQNGGTLQTGTVITVTFDANTTAKVWTLMEVVSSTGTPTFDTQGVGTGSATASPTVTSSSLPTGRMIIGMVCNEYGTAQTPTGDSDTTNGSWSTMQTNEIGTTAAGQTIITQRKVVTAAGTQTYNPTLGTSSDVIAAWISIKEVYSLVCSEGSYSLTGQDVAIKRGLKLPSDAGAFTLTGQNITLTRALKFITDAESFIFTGENTTLRKGYNFITSNATFDLTGSSLALTVARKVTAEGVSFSLTGQNTGVLAGKKLISDSGVFTFTGGNSGLVSARKLVSEAGGYLFTGESAGVIKQSRLVSDNGAFVLSGQNAGVLVQKILSLLPGPFILVGEDVGLSQGGGGFSIEEGVFTFNGTEVSLKAGKLITASQGEFVVNGEDIGLNFSTPHYTMIMGPASYAITGYKLKVIGKKVIVYPSSSPYSHKNYRIKI